MQASSRVFFGLIVFTLHPCGCVPQLNRFLKPFPV